MATSPTPKSAPAGNTDTAETSPGLGSDKAKTGDEPDTPVASSSEQPESESAIELEEVDDADVEEILVERLQRVVNIRGTSTSERRPAKPRLQSFDLQGVADLICSGHARRIICMVGAGISVSAGIPDFRSPGTGLYDNLQKYGLPHPQAVFELDYFRNNPRPFFTLAKELFPGRYRATPTHFFMRLLHDKGLLLRCFSQNIDSLEREAGLPASAYVAAHGNFDSATCISCRKAYSASYVEAVLVTGSGDPCICADCEGYVKPDIVFFGESLPERYHELVAEDFEQCDLLIVMGTSLVVQPFASLIDEVEPHVPRVLINRERVGEGNAMLRRLGMRSGFNFGRGNTRDVLVLGDCDDAVLQLSRLLGWEEELLRLVQGAKPVEAKI